MSAGVVGAIALAASILAVPLAQAATPGPGSFTSVSAKRVLDTRKGIGAPAKAVAAGATLTFTAASAGSTPISAVAMIVTAVAPKASGFLTVYAAGTARPNASILNFRSGEDVPNLVIIPVGAGGRVSIYNSSAGTVQLLADIHGYFNGGAGQAAAGTLEPMAPTRFLDTRTGNGAARRPAAANSTTKVKVTGLHGVPVDASAVVVNVTSVNASTEGYVTAFPGDPRPDTSTVNFSAHDIRANLILLAVGTDGTISLYNGAGPADLLADISGYFVGGTPSTDGSFVGTSTYRAFDSRLPGGHPAGPVTNSKICVLSSQLDNQACPTDPVFSIFKDLVVNVTAVRPTQSGFLTTWSGVGHIPTVSSSNFMPGSSYAGTLALPVNPDGTISVYNGSHGTVDLVVDVTGFILQLPDLTTARSSSASVGDQLAQALAKVKQFSSTPAAVPVSVTTLGR